MPIGVQDGVSLLKGEFAGYKDCTICAVADKSGMICKVSVIFPTMDKYYSIFDGDNGEIQLEITHQSMTCYVMLSYFDNANQEKLRKQIMDDL